MTPTNYRFVGLSCVISYAVIFVDGMPYEAYYYNMFYIFFCYTAVTIAQFWSTQNVALIRICLNNLPYYLFPVTDFFPFCFHFITAVLQFYMFLLLYTCTLNFMENHLPYAS